jgi:hypothetical protein
MHSHARLTELPYARKVRRCKQCARKLHVLIMGHTAYTTCVRRFGSTQLYILSILIFLRARHRNERVNGAVRHEYALQESMRGIFVGPCSDVALRRFVLRLWARQQMLQRECTAYKHAHPSIPMPSLQSAPVDTLATPAVLEPHGAS